MKGIHFQSIAKFDWLTVHFDFSVADENKNCINQITSDCFHWCFFVSTLTPASPPIIFCEKNIFKLLYCQSTFM